MCKGTKTYKYGDILGKEVSHVVCLGVHFVCVLGAEK